MAATDNQPRQRSPRYPAIPLDEALERVRALYRRERRNATPIPTVAEHWGLAPKSSLVGVTVGSLKQYGLVEDDGGGQARRIRLTEAAVRIITDEREDSSDRTRLIREAALKPELHRDLWDQFAESGLPSDSSLAHELRWNRNFTDAGIKDFVKQFRQTVAFAGLQSFDRAVESEADQPPIVDSAPDRPPTRIDDLGSRHRSTGSQSVNQILLPIAPGEFVTLGGAFPLTEAKWAQMVAVLHAMKPALVLPAVEAPRPDADAEEDAGA
jgi:hypothetical protein